MLIVDSNGDYAVVAGSRTLDTSEHPVYQARIEVALMIDSWLYAPAEAQDLARFKAARETPAAVDEFKKELLFGLKKYSPEVVSQFADRGAVSFGLQISQDALDATVQNS